LLKRWLATTDGERAAMGQRALQTFQEHYDMRRNAEAILRVFERAEAAPAITSAKRVEAN